MVRSISLQVKARNVVGTSTRVCKNKNEAISTLGAVCYIPTDITGNFKYRRSTGIKDRVVQNNSCNCTFRSKSDHEIGSITRTGRVGDVLPTASPWLEQEDPNGSGLLYYWNTETDETTALGASKPYHWVEVSDPAGSGESYFWCPETDATTAIGEPKPSYLSGTSTAGHGGSGVTLASAVGFQNRNITPRVGPLHIAHQQQQRQQQQQPPVSFMGTMGTYVVLGAGMTFGMVAVRAIFGF